MVSFILNKHSMEEETILFGVPVPSTNKVFLTIVVIHIFLGIICVLAGLLAMLAVKTGTRHKLAGKTYYVAMLFAFITTVILSIMRWPHNTHLLIIGILAFAMTHTGKRLAYAHSKNWTRLHTICMGTSYILLLTGFYVDNGKNLPFWNQFPQLFFWFFPAAVGVPIIILTLKRHPLNRIKGK